MLDAYIERRLHEVIDSKEYLPNKQPTAKQTRHWLIWLAKQIREQSKDEFSIEELQPPMLFNDRQKTIYGLTLGAISGLMLGIFAGSVSSIFTDLNNAFIFVSASGLFIGCIAGLILGLTENTGKVKVIEVLKFSSSKFILRETFRGSLQGILVGTIIGAFMNLLPYSAPLLYLILTFSGGFAIIFGVAASFEKDEIISKLSPNQGIFATAKNSVALFFYFFYIN